MNKHRVLLAAGGTGGHIFPALAVAEELVSKGYTIGWIASRQAIDSEILSNQAYNLYSTSVRGLRGKNKLVTLLNIFFLFISLIETLVIFLRFKPSMVLGMGGYVAGPAGIIAKLLGIPLAIHEQNKSICFTNKLLARFSSKVMVSFPDTYIKEVLTGNPVRKEISAILKPEIRFKNKIKANSNSNSNSNSTNILILGGSLGASSLNSALPLLLEKLPNRDELNIWHQAGRGNVPKLSALYKKLGFNNVRVEEFIGDMSSAYLFADLLIARAGATTIAELCAVGVASILIPYPYAAGRHQHKNAESLVSKGAAFMCEQDNLLGQEAFNLVHKLVTEPEARLYTAIEARKFNPHNASSNVVQECIELIK